MAKKRSSRPPKVPTIDERHTERMETDRPPTPVEGRHPHLTSASPANPSSPPLAPEEHRWTFLTNHSHVLILLAQFPNLVLREVAVRVGITERAVQRIIADLEEGGFIEREKIGRRNQYRILLKKPLRHPIEAHRQIGDLVALIADGIGKAP